MFRDNLNSNYNNNYQSNYNSNTNLNDNYNTNFNNNFNTNYSGNNFGSNTQTNNDFPNRGGEGMGSSNNQFHGNTNTNLEVGNQNYDDNTNTLNNRFDKYKEDKENDQIKKEKTKFKFNRLDKELSKTKADKIVEDTAKITAEELVNPLEGVRTAFFFRAHITGYIESGNFYDGDAVFCKYDFVVGNDWEKEEGHMSGLSQYSCRGEGNYDYMVWNMPFEVSFRSLNPFGWPQLVITCYAPDFLGRESIKGYGVVHIPTQPGRHERTVHIFSPITSSVISKFIGVLVGQKAEINNAPKVIASGDGREITRTKAEGTIKVVFQVTLRDMDKFGYSIQ